MYYNNLQLCFALRTIFFDFMNEKPALQVAHLHSYCCRFFFMDFHFTVFVEKSMSISDGRVDTQFRYQMCTHNFPTTHSSYAVCAKNM